MCVTQHWVPQNVVESSGVKNPGLRLGWCGALTTDTLTPPSQGLWWCFKVPLTLLPYLSWVAGGVSAGPGSPGLPHLRSQQPPSLGACGLGALPVPRTGSFSFYLSPQVHYLPLGLWNPPITQEFSHFNVCIHRMKNLLKEFPGPHLKRF